MGVEYALADLRLLPRDKMLARLGVYRQMLLGGYHHQYWNRICANCGMHKLEHVKAQCLLSPTRFKSPRETT